MSGFALLIVSALLVGLGALALLLWAIANGQYRDPDGDAQRILIKDSQDDCAG